MPSKGFAFIEHVIGHGILALLLAIVTRIALPTVSASLSKVRMSREQAYVASMKTDLLQLLMAEETHFRDLLTYASAVPCATPPSRGMLNLCPSRGNVLEGPTVVSGDAGPGWGATMTNIALPNVRCAIFVNAGAPYPALVEGTPLCRRPGWGGRANDTTGQI